MQSETISALAEALARAQGQFENPPKNRTVRVATRTGQAYEYSYAELPTILDAVRRPLSDNGLAITQVIRGGNLVTILTHASGQFLGSELPIDLDGPPQEIGSRLTYLRRYSLVSLLNIAADDDNDATDTLQAQVSITPRGTQKNAATGKPAAAKAKPIAANPGEYTIPVGTHKGKRPADLGLMELEAHLSELVVKMETAGKTIEQLPPETSRLIRELRDDRDRRAYEANLAKEGTPA